MNVVHCSLAPAASCTLKTMEKTQTLDYLHLTPSPTSSFGGILRLYRSAKRHGLNCQAVRKYLRSKETYPQHRPLRKKLRRRRIISVDINDQYQVDLADKQKFSKSNNGFKYILMSVDCLSRCTCANCFQKTTKNFDCLY